jgi:hypothetical protein
VRELLVTQEVHLLRRKSRQDVQEHFERSVGELREELERVRTQLSNKDTDLNKTKQDMEKMRSDLTSANRVLVHDVKHLKHKYDKLSQAHQSMVRRKEMFRLRTGPCVYVVQATDGLKVGMSGNISDRVAHFRTLDPRCRLLLVVYTNYHTTLEKAVLTRFNSERENEIIRNVSFPDLTGAITTIARCLHIEYTLESEDELDSFNIQEQPQSTEQPQHEQESAEPLLHENDNAVETEDRKRCGGFSHKTEEERLLPLTSFFANKGNADGRSRLCRECYMTSVYGDQRKRQKIVPVPDHDKTVSKWCNRCERENPHTEFFQSRSTRDGLYANCRPEAAPAREKNGRENRGAVLNRDGMFTIFHRKIVNPKNMIFFYTEMNQIHAGP